MKKSVQKAQVFKSLFMQRYAFIFRVLLFIPFLFAAGHLICKNLYFKVEVNFCLKYYFND